MQFPVHLKLLLLKQANNPHYDPLSKKHYPARKVAPETNTKVDLHEHKSLWGWFSPHSTPKTREEKL
jgi:hypothetical protein